MQISKIFLILLLCFVFQPYAEAGYVKRWVVKKITPKPTLPSTEDLSGDSNILVDEDPYKQCKAAILPSFITNSMGWSTEGLKQKYGVDEKYTLPIIGEIGKDMRKGLTAYRGLKALSPPSIIVTAAGNEHPAPVTSIKTKAAKDFDAIIVGSLSPSGWKSEFSREGEAVHIMAPSDWNMTSTNDDGRYRRFGGTSGATPLVTAGLAGFEWLSGYHPTAKEAKFLLEKTAIPTPHSHEKPRKNGVGMLNSYKLGMVGKELRRLCGRNISCFRRMIRNPSVYNFPADLNLFEAVDQAFPGCSRTCGGTNESCVNKAAVFKRLRKASLLNPGNKKAWASLACIYNEAGFTKEAKAALNTYKSLFPPKGPTSRYSCRSDSDCTLAPVCLLKNRESSGEGDSFDQPIIGNMEGQRRIERDEQMVRAVTHAEAETHYTSILCKKTLCNGKCRCDSVEKVSNTRYSSKCVNSRCVLFQETEVSPLPKDSAGGSTLPSNLENQGSTGQR